jgi:hypothetical protein
VLKKISDIEKSGLKLRPIESYFIKLSKIKAPDDDVPSNEQFTFVIKKLSAILFFKSDMVYQRFITWITAFYPFSLLYQHRLIHADFADIKRLTESIEVYTEKNNIGIFIFGSVVNDNFYIFNAVLDENKKKDVDLKIEKLLNKKYGSVYVRRDTKHKIRILIPNDSFNQLLAK